MSQRLAMFPIQPFVYPLSVEYYGDTDPATGSELKAMESVFFVSSLCSCSS